MKTTKILLAILLVITTCRIAEIFDSEITKIITGEKKLWGVVERIGNSFEIFEKEAPSTLIAHFRPDRLSTKLSKDFSNHHAYEHIEKLIYWLLEQMIQEIEVVITDRNVTIRLSTTCVFVTIDKIGCLN